MAKLSTLLLSLALVAASAAEAVLDLKPDTFDDVVLKSGKPALVEFFAPWCGREYSWDTFIGISLLIGIRLQESCPSLRRIGTELSICKGQGHHRQGRC